MPRGSPFPCTHIGIQNHARARERTQMHWLILTMLPSFPQTFWWAQQGMHAMWHVPPFALPCSPSAGKLFSSCAGTNVIELIHMALHCYPQPTTCHHCVALHCPHNLSHCYLCPCCATPFALPCSPSAGKLFSGCTGADIIELTHMPSHLSPPAYYTPPSHHPISSMWSFASLSPPPPLLSLLLHHHCNQHHCHHCHHQGTTWWQTQLTRKAKLCFRGSKGSSMPSGVMQKGPGNGPLGVWDPGWASAQFVTYFLSFTCSTLSCK